MRRIVAYGPALVVLLTACVLLVVAPAIVRSVGFVQTGARIQLAQQTLHDDDILDRISRAQIAIAEMVEPSVVHIDVSGRSTGRRRGAMGSGWVYDRDGHIITNAHVVRGVPIGQEVMVSFASGRALSAELVAADAFTDIAVLKVDERDGIFPARRATGVRLAKGQKVFAFGSPFGFRFSMSEGLISALGRDPRGTIGRNGFTNFIQTDAAVNPGNSGGPLVDANGRVVGMNVAIATGADNQGTSEEGQSAGISFAIPVTVIESVVDQLIEHGEIERGFLGINFQPDTIELTRDGHFEGLGVHVSGVQSGRPASWAGIERGDLIIAFNGERFQNTAQFRSWVSSSPSGSTIVLTVVRDADYEYARTRDGGSYALAADGGTPEDVEVTLGIFTRAELVPEHVDVELRKLGLFMNEMYPSVDRVVDGSTAAEAGFIRGMVIRGVDGERLDSLDDLMLAIEKAGFLRGQSVSFDVVTKSDDGDESIHLELPAP